MVISGTYLHLGRVYVRLDQPLMAIDVYEQGLKTFPGEVKLMLAIARLVRLFPSSFVELPFFQS